MFLTSNANVFKTLTLQYLCMATAGCLSLRKIMIMPNKPWLRLRLANKKKPGECTEKIMVTVNKKEKH